MRWEGVGRMGGEGGEMGRREMEREEMGEVGEVMWCDVTRHIMVYLIIEMKWKE
jgi:hypothetical protein